VLIAQWIRPELALAGDQYRVQARNWKRHPNAINNIRK